MLAQLNMEIEGEGLNYNMGSLFHGYIMENINPAYAEYFHYNETNPFTSCIYREKLSNKFFWRITTFNKKAYDIIISYFLENSEREIYIKHKNLKISIKSFSLKKDSFENLFLNSGKIKRIQFLTPTSYKSNGRTQIFPNIQTLILGVIKKINTHSDSIKFEDEIIIKQLLDKIEIRDYNLKTQFFHIEKVKIKGFIGTLDLTLKENDSALLELLNFIIQSSEYVGMGIKTSLGMGGVKIG